MKKQIAQIIKSKRLESGLSQTKLAERAGVRVATISDLENEKIGITVDLLERIIKGLGKKLIINIS